MIYNGETSLVHPFGLYDRNALLTDTHVLRFVNNNDFYVNVIDREKPLRYTFVIFTEARGGSTFFTDLPTYTIDCPSSLNFVTNPFDTIMSSFKGATGLNVLFSFS